MSAEPAIRLDPGSAVPPFEQVRQQISDLITHGVLVAGERLPPVRQLAGDLGLANGTVARAYQELETAGLILTSRGGGTRVASAPTLSAAALAEALAQHTHAYVTAARRLGATNKDITDALRHALQPSKSLEENQPVPQASKRQ